MQMWTLTHAGPKHAARAAAHAEQAGWDGLCVVDSQNLSGDSYVALAAAALATTRLGLGTGVTNSVTRHPAVTAGAMASVHYLSEGRASLGIGRGDSALAHLGRAPASVASFERYLIALQRYLRREAIPFDELDFHERLAPPLDELGLAEAPDASRLNWLTDALPKVPVEVAATGPKVIRLAALHGDLVMLTLGADVDRLRWGIETARSARREAGLDPDGVAFGAYVNPVCHPDRDTARALVRGGLTTFARFSVMHGSVSGPTSGDQAAVLGRLHDHYDMRSHTRSDSRQAALMTPEFIDRYAIVGDPGECRTRLGELAALGLSKLVVSGPSAGADRDAAREAISLLEAEVIGRAGT